MSLSLGDISNFHWRLTRRGVLLLFIGKYFTKPILGAPWCGHCFFCFFKCWEKKKTKGGFADTLFWLFKCCLHQRWFISCVYFRVKRGKNILSLSSIISTYSVIVILVHFIRYRIGKSREIPMILQIYALMCKVPQNVFPQSEVDWVIWEL